MHQPEPLAAQLVLGPGELLTGDIGLVAVRAMLENGVGYVVGAWGELPSPIDTAVEDARSGVFAARGIALRRLRSASALDGLVTAPVSTWMPAADGSDGGVARGVVVFGGRRGLRPVLERFVRLQVPGAVVGICHDIDAVRIPDAAVLDPEPTAAGLMTAMDQAFAISARTGRPAIVLVRSRLLGMRGTVRCRAELAARAAASQDAALPREQSLAEAARACGALQVERALAHGDARRLAGSPVVIAVGPVAGAVHRALSELAHRADAARPGAGALVDHVAVVGIASASIVPDLPEVAALLAASPTACLLGPASAPSADGIDALLDGSELQRAAVDMDAVAGDAICRQLGTWLAEHVVDADDVDVRAALVGATTVATNDLSARVPRRGEVLHRTVSPSIAAGLALAQGVIGVPTRSDLAYPTYQSATGVPLTIAPTELFAEHGTACAAPGSAAGVFVVTGTGAGVAERAASMGATVEPVDGGSPRALGVAIAKACRMPRTQSHVILVTEPEHVSGGRAHVLGIDPELVGTDRIASAAVPRSSTTLVDYGSELVAGPVELVLDTPQTAAKLPHLRELSAASWDLRVSGRGGKSRWNDSMWNLRRRLVRIASGVDL